jgi:hypothetical protein
LGRIDWALKFYVAERHGAPLLLVPSLGGVPEVAVPTYPILRVSYLSLESTASEQKASARLVIRPASLATVAEVGTGWPARLCASRGKPVVGAVVKTGKTAVVLDRH